MVDRAGRFRAEAVLLGAGTYVLEVGGDLDLLTSRELERTLYEIPPGEATAIVADLSDFDFVDLYGLCALVAAARLSGARLALVAPNPTALRRLELTGLGRGLEIHPTRARALTGAPGVSLPPCQQPVRA